MSDAPSDPAGPSRPFRDMAAKVQANTEGFAGAFVVVLPDGSYKELLLVNRQPDLAMLWAMVDQTCKMAITELEQQSRSGYGGRGF